MVFVLILKVNLKPSRMWEMHFFALELNFTNLVARKRKYSWSQHQIDLPFCISYYTTSFWFCFSMSRYFCLLSSLSWEFPLEFSTILSWLPPSFSAETRSWKLSFWNLHTISFVVWITLWQVFLQDWEDEEKL